MDTDVQTVQDPPAVVELDDRFGAVVESLKARTHGPFDEVFIQNLVSRVAAECSDAPVQDYVEVLVAKEAADEPRRLNALVRIAS